MTKLEYKKKRNPDGTWKVVSILTTANRKQVSDLRYSCTRREANIILRYYNMEHLKL